MPRRHELEIAEQPDHTLAPRFDGSFERKRPVHTGDTVFFAPEQGAKRPPDGPGISFVGDAPFLGQQIDYGRNLVVTAKHRPGGEAANVYTYTCTFITKDGRRLSTGSGGEIEILPGEG
jgi:hypothetical protein